MGKMKELYFKELEAMQEAFNSEHLKCSCPPSVGGLDQMCPHCLAEYEQHLVDHYEAYEEAGLIMSEEQYEREIEEQMDIDKEKIA